MIGVNIAWGIVDGVMYVIGSYFTRNRYATISKALNEDRDNAKAKEAIVDDLDNTIIHTMNSSDRERIVAIVADAVPSIH